MPERIYNSIYLKKTTYNTWSNATIIKRWKIKKTKPMGAWVHIMMGTDGKIECVHCHRED